MYSCAKMLPAIEVLPSIYIFIQHNPSPPPTRFPKLFRTQLPARPPHPIPKPTLPLLPCFSHFPAQPQTEERETTLHHHHHHCCWIVIRFRVDSWCGSSIILLHLSPHLSKMKSTFWNGMFIARGHNKAHYHWHSIASQSYNTCLMHKFPFIFPKEPLLNTE